MESPQTTQQSTVNPVGTPNVTAYVTMMEEPDAEVFQKWFGWIILLSLLVIFVIWITTNFSSYRPVRAVKRLAAHNQPITVNVNPTVVIPDIRDTYDFVENEIITNSLNKPEKNIQNDVEAVNMNQGMGSDNPYGPNSFVPFIINSIGGASTFSYEKDMREGLMVSKPYDKTIQVVGNSESRSDLQDYMAMRNYNFDTPSNPVKPPNPGSTYYTSGAYYNLI